MTPFQKFKSLVATLPKEHQARFRGWAEEHLVECSLTTVISHQALKVVREPITAQANMAERAAHKLGYDMLQHAEIEMHEDFHGQHTTYRILVVKS